MPRSGRSSGRSSRLGPPARRAARREAARLGRPNSSSSSSSSARLSPPASFSSTSDQLRVARGAGRATSPGLLREPRFSRDRSGEALGLLERLERVGGVRGRDDGVALSALVGVSRRSPVERTKPTAHQSGGCPRASMRRRWARFDRFPGPWRSCVDCSRPGPSRRASRICWGNVSIAHLGWGPHVLHRSCGADQR